jgi:hypothetical protein
MSTPEERLRTSVQKDLNRESRKDYRRQDKASNQMDAQAIFSQGREDREQRELMNHHVNHVNHVNYLNQLQQAQQIQQQQLQQLQYVQHVKILVIN